MSVGLRFLFDENVHGDIIDGFLQRNPTIDAVRAQDVGLRGADDTILLDWAIANSRIVVSVDKRTLPPEVWNRVKQGGSFPGVVILRISLSIGSAIKELEFLANAGTPDDFVDQIIYLPL